MLMDAGHSAYRSLLRLLQTALQAYVLGMGAYITFKGGMTGEQLTSFLFYTNFVSAASFDVGDRWTSIQDAIGSTTAVFQLMDRRTKLQVRYVIHALFHYHYNHPSADFVCIDLLYRCGLISVP